MRNITVEEYSPEWPELYRKEAEKVKEIVRGNEVAIYHIGSTSVVGLKAKPVIDILLVVREIQLLDQQTALFERLGYEAMGELGLPQRRFFRKGGDHRTHHIHAYQFDNSQEILRHLCFRDYLVAHPTVAQEYGQLKQALALKFPNDIEQYGDGKDAFVKRIEAEALMDFWQQRAITH
ncbi:hypothetical protein BAU15_03685 [Enterococcus sp. JM4C]|uniref:GrpB family protein n=1 Tax=Candidatus Enterococcus huntleyi TaxID=1857217 RepID=UPI0013799C9B|nr:GrpB family protein [Enterococcus sp. JM4C]KAF1295653.1 hypothetical protein BAU15_03685 [Enterococcus sp. JM4C]